MEKFGVACGCASGTPDLGGMEKLAGGERRCGICGATHKVAEIKMSDSLKVRDNSDEKPPAESQ